MQGVSLLAGEDYFNIANYLLQLLPVGMRVEAGLSFVLALNRLKIICGLRYPDLVHIVSCHSKKLTYKVKFQVLVVTIWAEGAVCFVSLFTPCCEFGLVPGNLLVQYNMSNPSTVIFTKILFYVLYIPIALTLIIYLVIIVFIIRMKFKYSTGSAIKEKSILAYAIIRFIVDVTIGMIYFHGNLPHTDLCDFFLTMSNLLNNLLTAPTLYLIMNR
ncbi:hypothetical protein L596_026875 [Steinernema carpocapsae]|uniref:G-protein coupled receptors family 1 profile domain-containing protein n=1 Tax=Steinernema carpocapsae TaxID=34508 RepID=A0A4U5M2M7_STECR|nr:hypothetical protein L596_026875 [Steinernema carpocapsae]